MMAELQLFDGSMLTEAERTNLEKQIDNIVAAYKGNRQEINRLVFESNAVMTEAEEYEDELSSRKGLKRFWGAITGSNKALQDKISTSRGAAQYAAQQTINKIVERDKMTFDLLIAVNSKLDASKKAAGAQITRIYTGLLSFFKQYKSDLIKTANRIDKLEQNVNLLNWQNSIEYQMLDGIEYAELDDASKIAAIVRDFYDITQGQWTTSDLLLLKTAMNSAALDPNGVTTYGAFIKGLSSSRTARDYFFANRELKALPPVFDAVLLGIKKNQQLQAEEKYIVESNAELFAANDVDIDAEQIREKLLDTYLQQEARIALQTEIIHYDLLVTLLHELDDAERLSLIDSSGIDNPIVVFDASAEVQDLTQEITNFDLLSGNLHETNAAQDDDLLCGDSNETLNEAADGGANLEADSSERSETDAVVKGKEALDNGQYITAFQNLTAAAERGNAVAQYRLGTMYHLGLGLEPDHCKAVQLYQRAADQGLAEAQNGLGLCYDSGQGVEQDRETATEWYRKAAEQNYGSAEFNLGLQYEMGTGVAHKDLIAASEFFRRALNHGVDTAQEALKRIERELRPAPAPAPGAIVLEVPYFMSEEELVRLWGKRL